MTAPQKRPSWAEIDDAYRAHHGNPHYQPDSLPAKAAEDAAEATKKLIAQIKRTLRWMLRIMFTLALAVCVLAALLTFAAAKVAEVQAMPRWIEGVP